MPAWYVHMESARETVNRLRDGDIPPGFPISAAEAKEVGEICHTWRNYLAIGAIGPDLFYMLPDYAHRKDQLIDGLMIRKVLQWVLDVWGFLDENFVAKWEKWISPVSTDADQLASQLTGGLANQFADILNDLTKSVTEAFRGLIAKMGDWFGVLSSGPPQAFPNSAFYWADQFHYRRTYQFAFVLFQQAHAALDAATNDEERFDAQTRMAFAVGWLTHCATDVTGHPFTNAKSGGPFRDHWQRHHLVELHFDSQNYSAHNSGPCYGEVGTSAMHFWVAFRKRMDGPYTGREDAPAYDYFTGFPSYDNSDTPTAAARRHELFDLDTGDFPDHLVDALLRAMTDVHPDGPQILTQDPQYSADDASGRPNGQPNAKAMVQMWAVVYTYMKLTGSDGLSPRRPTPPLLTTDHSFPTPPGGGYGVDDDPARGADVEGDSSFSILDLFLAILAWAIYLAEVIIWLVTILPSLGLDLLTKWARDIVYQIQLAAWYLFILARRALVMTGFLIPKPEELDLGLTTLGTGEGAFDVAGALDDPLGDGFDLPIIDEPSGRATSTSPFGLDRLYPRNVVRDHFIVDPSISDLLGFTFPMHYAFETTEFKPSEWIAPWRYPVKNQAGETVIREGAGCHAGPYVAGDTSSILLPGPAGDDGARHVLEQCASPADTFDALNQLFPEDKHLGGPVDYGVYLVGRMVAERGNAEFGVTDFNLDSDRGYAWKCWDWDRHNAGPPTTSDADPPIRGKWECVPDFIASPQSDFRYLQPCTPPHFFHADRDNPRIWKLGGQFREPQFYNPKNDLRIHYLSRAVQQDPPATGPDPCEKKVGPGGPKGPDWSNRWTDAVLTRRSE
ncbi:MAG: hypothetical protein M3S32_05320 [Acidobacteriota bacterium]|nr:hypothetical protein [Acidobacteriota bacterium]